MPDQPDRFRSNTNESMQSNLDRGEPLIFASYSIVGAVVLLGGLGYVLDRRFDSGPWFFLGGVAIGLCIAFYTVIKTARARS